MSRFESSNKPERVSIRQLPTGVPGLDEILGGGIPEYSFNIIAGSPGCGKTTLAHQIVFANATLESPALYCLPSTEIIVSPGLEAHGDPPMIRLVIENLLNNACKYSFRAENPVIVFGQHDGAFFVRDNGIGFEMKYLHEVFLPFERLHNDSSYTGSGIGLANVKRIVEKHGGKVWAESTLGQGATFFFTLGS